MRVLRTSPRQIASLSIFLLLLLAGPPAPAQPAPLAVDPEQERRPGLVGRGVELDGAEADDEETEGGGNEGGETRVFQHLG